MKKIEELRSYRWFHGTELIEFRHNSRLKQMGYSKADFANKPIIGIINTWSDLNPCHQHFRQRADDVKRGVLQAGGFPVELPALSISETYMKPSPMMYRNLLSMEVEEILRSQPIDGAVLMGGCDKTTPGLLMGAFSMDIPAIFVPAGPMLRGAWGGKILGSGTDQIRYTEERRAGTITDEELEEIEGGIARSAGTCMTMGTASTMTSLTEVLGFSLPGASSIPAVDSNHPRMASDSGRRIVEMVFEDLKPTRILTEKSFENAMIASMALGGSTNAIIHLIAMAGRIGLDITLDKFDEVSRRTPMLANIRPSGEYLMEDFFYAGGLKALLNQLGDLLHLDQRCASGKTLGQQIEGAKVYDDKVIRSLENPVEKAGSTVVLRGNLAPNGCVLKQSATNRALLQHKGPAVVFSDYGDMKARMDDPDLDVTADSVLVLQNSGPKGAPGMPEWGSMPIPKKLLQQGVRDMVRISDARMSGTAFGVCILHVSPESHVGGPLALVQDGDLIELDTENRSLELHVDTDELQRRREAMPPPEAHYGRGYGALFCDNVTQADKGCDFPFLSHGKPTPDPKLYG